jgi:peroxiredoxin (alkyl hydroperoxide reductase subunit C)
MSVAHDKRVAHFKERNVEIVGVSIDSQFTHFAWRNTAVDDGGIGPIQYPMVADITHDITRAYGVEHPDGVALRASFLIDKGGIVQHQVVNNLPLGRNVDEKGESGMTPNADGVSDYLSKHSEEL